MKLRDKTLAVMVLLSVFLLVLMWVLVRGVLFNRLAARERQMVEAALAQAQAYLVSEERQLALRANDWAVWDETYQFVQDRNQRYIENNLSNTTMGSLRLNLMAFFGLDGKLVYAKALDVETRTEIPLSAPAIAGLGRLALRLDQQDINACRSGLLFLDGRMTMLAVRPVLKTQYLGPSRGALVIGEFIDAGELKPLGRIVRGELGILPRTDAAVPMQLRETVAFAALPPGIVLTRAGRTAAGYSVLRDVFGRQELVLRVEQQREMLAWGEKVERLILVGLVLLAALFTVVLGFALERTVLARLSRLSREVAAVGESGDPGRRVELGGADELARLAGQINRMLGGAQDAQAVLRESEERYKTLYHHTPVMLLSLDAAGSLLSVSDYWLEKTGYRRVEVVGRPWVKFLAEDSRREALSVIMPRFQGSGRIRDVPLRLIKQDGATMDVLLSAITERDEGGRFRRALAVMADVTERKWAEEQMLRRAAEIEAITGAFPDLYFRTDQQGRFLDYIGGEKADLYVPPSEFIGKTHWEVLPREVAQALDAAIREARQAGVLVPAEYELKVSGTVKHFEARVVPMKGDNLLTVVRNITEKKRAEIVQGVLLRISEAASTSGSLYGLLEIIHAELARLIHVGNFFVALYDARTALYDFPYFVDELDTEFFPQPMPHSLTDYVRSTGKPLLADTRTIEEMIERGVIEQHGPMSLSWIGAPLNTAQGALGVVVAQSYAGGAAYVYTENDLELLTLVSGDIAMAIERRRAEDALRASEERYRSFVEQSSEAIWRFELEEPIEPDLPEDELIEAAYARAYLAECNDAMAHMYGFEHAAELVGARLGDLLVASDPRNAEYLRAFIRGGFRIQDAESQEVDREGRMHVFLNNLIGILEDGKLVRAWGTQRDITERRAAEEALRTSEEHLRLVIDLVPHFIFAKDAGGRFVLVNEAVAEAYGTTVEELLGKRDADFSATPAEVGHFLSDDLAVIQSGIPKVIPEERITDARGAVRYFETVKIPFTFRGAPAVLGVATNITERRRAQEALRASREELQRMADGVPVLLAHFDQDFRCLFANRMYVDWFGPGAGEVTGRTLAEILPADAYRHAEPYIAAARAGQPVSYEAPAYAQDLSRIVQVAVVPHMGGDGAVLGYYVMINDITALKRAEEALRDSEERYRGATLATGQLIYDYDIGSGRVHWAGAIEQITGYTPAEFQQLDMRGWQALIHPDERACAVAGLEGALGECQPYSVEYRFQRKDGTYACAEDNGSFLVDAAGKPYRMLGAMRDVTERRRAAQALQMSEESYRRLVELAQEGIVTVDDEERIMFANPAFLAAMGYAREELAGRSLLELCDERGRQVALRGTQQRRSGVVSTYEIVLSAKSGERKTFLVAACPLLDEAGCYEGALGVLTDVTERKRAEQALAYAQKLESLGVLAGGIAHDFNNLLVGVMGNAGLALREVPKSSPARRYLEDIETASQRAADLTRQMLAYSGKGQLAVQLVDLSVVVEEITRLLEAAIPRHVMLKFDLGRGLPAVEGDPVQIRQVAMNLILNAAEALGEERGVVVVTTGVVEADREYLRTAYIDEELPEGRYVCLEVGDTGCGMDPGTQARIFDPFFTTKFAGRGLGLAAVLGIVRSHRGSIKVYSELGKGSTFKVLFPARQAAQVVPQAAQSAESSWRGEGLVLVVDDEPTVRAVAKRVLEQQGFSVLTASDGDEGLRLFKQHATAVLVLLDMTMPRLSGEETYREMRKLRADARVVLSSGYNEQDATTKFAGKGLAGFLQKPYSPGELLAKVREVLGYGAQAPAGSGA